MPRDPEDKLVAPPDFDGPTKHRHCTDILCFILLIVSWVAMTGIGYHAVMEGDMRLVINPLDYDGNVCGTDFAANMTEYPNLLYVNHQTGGVCVKECPNLENVTEDGLTDVRTLITYNGIFQLEGAELDANYIEVGDYSGSEDALSCDQNTCFPNDSVELSWISPGIRKGWGFAFYATSTFELLNRCYATTAAERQLAELVEPNRDSNATDSSTQIVDKDIVSDAFDFTNKLFADVYLARKYVFGLGFGLSMAISMVYIFLMRLPGLLTAVVWGSIFSTISMCLIGGYYAWTKASEWRETDYVGNRGANLTAGFGVFLFVLGALLVILACTLRRSIMDAILCTREAGRAVNSMTLILLVPVLQSVGFLVFLVPFIYYAAHLASLGNITMKDIDVGPEIALLSQDAPEISIRVFEFDDTTEYMGWYLLFCLFWTANFIVAMGDLIISVSVAKWYFTKSKWKIGSWTVLGSIVDVAWYHAGTAAFGSLLIATVQLIRAILVRMQRWAKKTNNKIAQAILSCCQCCFWCLECMLKFINKNAYIQTAIFSTSFCESCRESFALIFRNAGRVAAITYVSAAVLIIGKLFISSVVTVLGYYVISEEMGEKLHTITGPLAVIFVISYWISDMFMDVLDMGISTVLHCFIADEEMFAEGQRYSDKSLKNYVDRHGGRDE